MYTFLLAVLNIFQKQDQNACFRDLVFTIFSEVANRFKQCHNACFRYLVLIFFNSIMLQIVPNSVRVHALSCTILPSMFSKLLLYLYLYLRAAPRLLNLRFTSSMFLPSSVPRLFITYTCMFIIMYVMNSLGTEDVFLLTLLFFMQIQMYEPQNANERVGLFNIRRELCTCHLCTYNVLRGEYHYLHSPPPPPNTKKKNKKTPHPTVYNWIYYT